MNPNVLICLASHTEQYPSVIQIEARSLNVNIDNWAPNSKSYDVCFILAIEITWNMFAWDLGELLKGETLGWALRKA